MKIIIDTYKKNKIRKCYFCEKEDYNDTREIDCYISVAFRLKINDLKEVCICESCMRRITLDMIFEGKEIKIE